MTVEVVSLASESCLEVSRVGAKAATLAAALQRGFPVLPGLVVPVDISCRLLAWAAAHGLARGVHAARFAVMDADLPELGGLAARVSGLAEHLVVRSSSPLEGASECSGAFASYLGVTPDDVETAVRGVWASALAADGLARGRGAEATGPGSPGMAVLVQPEIGPECSGTAEVCGDTVSVVVVKGSPAPLLAGWARGETARFEMAAETPCRFTGDAACSLAGAEVLTAVAALALRVHHELGEELIEWAATREKLLLLQAKRAGSSRSTLSRPPTAELAVPPAAAGVARLVHAFAGPLGEDLVLPAVLAGVTSATRVPSSSPGSPASESAALPAWNRALAIARWLRWQSWGGLDAGDGPAPTLARLRGGILDEALDRLGSLPAADPNEVASLLGLLRTVGDRLADRGLLRNRDEVWGLPESAVSGLVAGATPAKPRGGAEPDARRRALLRWEPVIHAAMMSTGVRVAGQPVSPGVGAGTAVLVRGVPRQPLTTPRMVLVAPHPIPQLAPLLWGASGLVTFGGSAAAHLVEIARSLGVPAVLGCPEAELLSLLPADGSHILVAVDGDRGIVAVDDAGTVDAGVPYMIGADAGAARE